MQAETQQEDSEEGPASPQAWQEAYYTLHLLCKMMKHCPMEVRLLLNLIIPILSSMLLPDQSARDCAHSFAVVCTSSYCFTAT